MEQLGKITVINPVLRLAKTLAAILKKITMKDCQIYLLILLKNLTMKTLNLSMFLIISFFYTSCGEISKEVAKEELIGKYKGTATYVVKFSQYNLGVPDSQESENCIISITKTDYGTYLNIPDGQIGIHNITLLINGVNFNIYEQSINSKDNTKLKLIGNPIYLDTKGNKSDGQYNKDINSLQFSFTASLKTEILGLQYEVPIIAYYDLKKQ
jgi:hypothetical protein